jgi:NAD(P)H dehydrogenase (quinone)
MVTAVCRDPARQWQAPGVSWAIGHYDDPSSLLAAFAGVDVLVMVSSDGEAHRVLAHHYNVVEAASASGVSRLVGLSSLDADLASPFCYAVTNGLTEARANDLGMSAAFARASIFTEFLGQWLLVAADRGELRLPFGDGRISLVSRADVAACLAALALGTRTGPVAVTGPTAVGLDDLAALAAVAGGAPVAPVKLSPDEFRAELIAEGLDAWWSYAYASMFESVRQDRWAEVADGVLALTGCQPATAAEVVTGLAAAATGGAALS